MSPLDLCGFCWLGARVAVAPALVGFQVDRGRPLFEELGRQARQLFNVAHRVGQGFANLGASLNSLPLTGSSKALRIKRGFSIGR